MVTSTNVQEAMGAVTAEVSMVKLPSNVALPAPVILLLEPLVTTKVNPPPVARASVPLPTVVLPP